MTNIFKYGLFIVTLALLTSCMALDEASAKERKCVTVHTTQDVDFQWMQSITKWYFPFWSKLELYRTASDITGEPVSSITASSLETACVISGPQFAVDGFNRTELKYDISLNEDGSIGFVSKSKYAKRGTHTIAHTDNQDFIVGITCWEDNEASYGIWTVEPTLSRENKEIVSEYLEQLGFDIDYMIETPYDKCQEGERFNSGKEEL